MATTTTKLGLTKPDVVDVVDISELNTNADEIDAAVGFTVCTNATRPASPYTGQSIFETDTGDSFIWDGSAWQPGGGGGSIEISATAPSSPAAGDLWWDSDNGNLYIYYTDVDSSQWVAANGPQVFVGTSAPAGYQGQLWFDSTTGKVYIYYDDGTSAQWVSAIGGSLAGSIVQVVSTTKTDTFSTTSTSFTDVTGLSATITPSSASSKVMVFANFGLGSVNDTTAHSQVVRDGVASYIGDASGSQVRSAVSIYSRSDISGGGWHGQLGHSIAFLDSPSSTSSLTYAVQLRTGGVNGTVYIGRSGASNDNSYNGRTPSSITLMEVAG